MLLLDATLLLDVAELEDSSFAFTMIFALADAVLATPSTFTLISYSPAMFLSLILPESVTVFDSLSLDTSTPSGIFPLTLTFFVYAYLNTSGSMDSPISTVCVSLPLVSVTVAGCCSTVIVTVAEASLSNPLTPIVAVYWPASVSSPTVPERVNVFFVLSGVNENFPLGKPTTSSNSVAFSNLKTTGSMVSPAFTVCEVLPLSSVSFVTKGLRCTLIVTLTVASLSKP